jgi:hypothetical protein
MNLARHLLFNRTGSQPSLYIYIDHIHRFCKWIQAEPDQLVSKCRNRNGNPNPKEIAIMTKALKEYIDYMRANNNASSRALPKMIMKTIPINSQTNTDRFFA